MIFIDVRELPDLQAIDADRENMQGDTEDLSATFYLLDANAYPAEVTTLQPDQSRSRSFFLNAPIFQDGVHRGIVYMQLAEETRRQILMTVGCAQGLADEG